MQKEETITIKDVSIREINERQDKLFLYYLQKIKEFDELFIFIDIFRKDLNLRKERQYNNITKITLILLKLLYNAKQDDDEKITNEDLIFIRWVAIKYYKFGFNKKRYNEYKKKYYYPERDFSSFEQVPEDYDKALKASWIWQTDATNIKKHLDAKKSDISSYLDGIPFDCICYCIQVLLIEVDCNKFWLISSIPLIKEGIKKYLWDIEIDHNELSYKECNWSYKGTKDSFNAVFYSTEWEELYSSTRVRFYGNYKDQLEKKYKKLIWKKEKNISKKKSVKK